MPGFPDKFMPFMNQPPGSLLSSSAVMTYGRAIHALRRFTQSHDSECFIQFLSSRSGKSSRAWAPRLSVRLTAESICLGQASVGDRLGKKWRRIF